MRRLMFLPLVAVGLWLLQAEAVTRDDFLMQTTQDLVDVCSVKPGEPSYEGALGFCLGKVAHGRSSRGEGKACDPKGSPAGPVG